MKTAESRTVRCANEGCARPAQPDDVYCAECCLERSLFRREERRPSQADRTVRAEEASAAVEFPGA